MVLGMTIMKQLLLAHADLPMTAKVEEVFGATTLIPLQENEPDHPGPFPSRNILSVENA